MSMTIIDAHAHLWLRQDGWASGRAVKPLPNGRADFLGEERQMLPPFMIDGRNSAEVFLSNMNYAGVSAAVITQEFIDGIQNDYLSRVQREYPDRFFTCGMCEYRAPGFLPHARRLIDSGFRGIAVPAHRLVRDDGTLVALDSDEMMSMFGLMQQHGVILSITLAEGTSQLDAVEHIIDSYPGLKIAVGHFGMVTVPGWMDQIMLARHPNVMIESGGITWLFNHEFYPFPGAVEAIRRAADAVGIDKLMWGSDYPRTITAITYRMSYDFVVKSTRLGEQEKTAFLGGNAARFYGFENPVELPYIKNMSE